MHAGNVSFTLQMNTCSLFYSVLTLCLLSVCENGFKFVLNSNACERFVDDLFLCGKHLAEHYEVLCDHFTLFKLNISSLHRNCYLLKQTGNAVPV